MNINDILNNKIELSGNGNGKFEKIREITNQLLKQKEVGVELSVVVKAVQKNLKLGSSQQAYNYVSNALKKDKRFFNFRTSGGRRILIRVDGDENLIKKLQEKTTEKKSE